MYSSSANDRQAGRPYLFATDKYTRAELNQSRSIVRWNDRFGMARILIRMEKFVNIHSFPFATISSAIRYLD